MNFKEMVKELVKLHILCTRWVERNTNFRCFTFRGMDSILKGDKFTVTYREAVENLKINIEKYCKSDYLLTSVLQLEQSILKSEIAGLRFGTEPYQKFTELEKELNTEVLKRTLYMTYGMVSIKRVGEILGLTEGAVKQACQQERLLNTQKVGKTWLVHIEECRAYWNIPDTDEGQLYNDWIY
ncbi:hypothetical protein SDC9_110209 [bioreactor metagenome]|uniref:Uncharacterized protein n=1 Tax=bioreactor metagenome TaxID=1076179 RepID=A0A645BCX1_9ZZZZ